MAILINATADTVRRNANIPVNASFTYMGDFIILSDLGAPYPQPLMLATIVTYQEAYGIYWEGGVTDGSAALIITDGGVNTGSLFSSRPEVNKPFCAFMRCNGTGANQFTGGWCYPGGPWVTASSTVPATVAQTTRIEIGSIASTYYSNCAFQNIKIWDWPLTDAELTVERDTAKPVTHLEYLNLYAPCPHHNDGFDRGPKARNLERSAALDTAYFDFKRPGKRRKLLAFEEPAAAGVFQVLAGPRFSLAGAHGLAGD